MNKTILLACLLLVAAPTPLIAETNYDFFFRNDAEYKDVLIKEVRSAQHFVIMNAQNKKEVIRLIGVKTPESPKIQEVDVKRDGYGFPIKPDVEIDTPIGEKAFRYMRDLLINQRVRLEFDRSKKNDDNQTLAYVYLLDDDTFVNAELLRKGFAQLQIRPPNTKYRSKLRAAYQEARREKRGLHGF